MRGTKLFGAVAVLAATVMLGLAGTAWARAPQTYTYANIPAPIINWSKPASAPVDFDWSTASNWTGAVVPGIVGGAANTTAQFPQWGITNNVNVKVNEAVDTGTNDIYIRLQSADGVSDMYLNGTGSLKCSTYWVRQSSDGVICQVPLEATTMVKLEWRWGYGRFENTVKTPIVRIGDGDFTFAAHDGNDQMNAVQMWKDQESTVPEMYQYNAIDPYTPGTPLSILIDDGGIYGGYVDGAFGTLAGNSASLIQGSTLIVGAAQTNFPSVEIEGGSVLAGDMSGLTSADFGLAGAGKKVTFEENSIYAPSPGGAEPTRAAMGGAAIIVKGIYDTSAAGTTTVGDDGSTSVYKGAGFGAFGTSTAINTTVAVLPNTGNLQIFVTGRNADLGAGTTLESVTTKAVDLIVPNGAANVSLVGGAINNGDLTGAKATTFNVSGSGPVQHDTILRFFNAGGEIAPGQTFNVKDGLVGIDTSSNTTFLKGTLEIDAGGALYNGTPWARADDTQWHTPLSASGGTIAFKDRGLLFLPPGQEGVYENINLTASGTPYVVLDTDPWGDGLDQIYTLTAAGTPKMLALLKASNIWVNAHFNDKAFTFEGDGVTVGNGNWIQGIDGRTKSSRVAGNIKADPGTAIGFAAIVDSFTVDANVVASGATVRFNTTDTLETCVYVNSNPAGNAHTNDRLLGVVPGGNIIVKGIITAETIKAQKGTLTLNQDLNVPNLDIAGVATVTMAAGKTATVTGTLSGTGKWTGGLGVMVAAGGKVAPGNGIGVLNNGGGVLTFDDRAIYKWQIGDPDGTPGSHWDLVKGSTITFLGELILDVDDSLLTGSIEGTESFIVASALSSMGALGSYSFLGDWHGTLEVVGTDLVLSGLSSGLPGDTNADGVVDAADFITLKKNFGGGLGGDATVGNFDKTGTVNWADLGILMSNMGKTSGAPATAPEPATLGLLAIGALAIIRRRRK